MSQQKTFLSKIESLIPSKSTLVNELSDILDISMDSAYRRMRGQTLLTIDEVIQLCRHFRLSFDSFISNEDGTVTFVYTVLKGERDNFSDYLKSLYRDLEMIKTLNKPLITYACQDIPVFHHHNYPNLSAFKMFYWMKSIMNHPGLQNATFSVNIERNEQLAEMAKKIYHNYCEIPSIEIWTDSTILSTVKQIEFYWEAGLFLTDNDALAVCESLREEISDIQGFAELRSKVKDSTASGSNDESPNYTLYYSEIEITNNCVLVSMDDLQAVYLGHFSFNTMSTTNGNYCRETEEWLNNLLKKSVKISGISEKQRNQFFRKAKARIDALEQKIRNPET